MLDIAKFRIGEIAEASGVSANTIRSWFQRGQLTLGLKDRDSPGNGMARIFSGRTALMIAIAGKLAEMGIRPERAINAAILFAHTGGDEPSTDWATDISPGREPGCLFTGEDIQDTLIILAADEHWRNGDAVIVPLMKDAKFASIINVGIYGQHGTEGATVLALFMLVSRVRNKLGLPRDGLE